MGHERFDGLDVQKESLVIAVEHSDESAPSVVSEISNDTSRLLRELRNLGKPGDAEADAPEVAWVTDATGSDRCNRSLLQPWRVIHDASSVEYE